MSLLAVVFDSLASSWRDRDDALRIDGALRVVMALLRAHVALSPHNDVLLVATTDRGPRTLYAPLVGSDSHRPMHDIEVSIESALQQLRRDDATRESHAVGTFAASLSLTLCVANRFLVQRSTSNANGVLVASERRTARVLAVHSGADDAAQYISTMNAIFCAQKLDVPIDACVLRSADVAFLQQAASISGGVYVRPSLGAAERALIQSMLLHFLPDAATRAMLNMPQQTSIDMRASCVCHGTQLDIGFVCSVCLSIYCDRSAICGTCHARFELPSIDHR